MNKLACINALIAVIEENGFAAAAKKQQVSTAAISRQIAALEANLGVALLKRSTRKVSLTEQGLAYFEECRQILSNLNQAENALKSSQQEASGQLHILSNRYFAEKQLIPKLKAFMQSNPLLTIKLELAERFPDFTKEDIDIAFGISMEGPSFLVRRQVARTRYVLCAAPSFLTTYGTPNTPQELIKFPYITHSMRQPDNTLLLDDNLTILVQPVLWFNDSRAMCDAAISGLGIVRLHDYVVEDALAMGSLSEILPEYQKETIPVYLYYQQNRFLQPKIRKCIDYFTAT
jgi:DNA-binding transcriptional LysR family regulator